MMNLQKLLCGAVIAAALTLNSGCEKLVDPDQAAVKSAVREVLNDPDSAQFRNFALLDDEACIEVNWKNSQGGYEGFYAYLLRKDSDRWNALFPFSAHCSKQRLQDRVAERVHAATVANNLARVRAPFESKIMDQLAEQKNMRYSTYAELLGVCGEVAEEYVAQNVAIAKLRQQDSERVKHSAELDSERGATLQKELSEHADMIAVSEDKAAEALEKLGERCSVK